MMAKLPIIPGKVPTRRDVIWRGLPKGILIAPDWWSNGIFLVREKRTIAGMKRYNLPVVKVDKRHRDNVSRWNRKAETKLNIETSIVKIDGFDCLAFTFDGCPETSIYIQTVYCRFLRDLYPNATLYGDWPDSPIVWRVGRKMVAMVMPVH